jgi:DNA primase
MIEQFSPLETTVDEPSKGSLSNVVELVDFDPDNYDSPTDISSDIAWTYANMARKGVEAEDAPHCGAWAMLLWARENRNRFFEQMLPKSKLIEKHAEEDIGRQEDEAQIADIHKLLDKAKRGWQQEAVADMDKAVREKVMSRMDVWEKQFQIDLPKDAREGLSLRMLRIVNDAVGAMAEHQVGSGPPLGVS